MNGSFFPSRFAVGMLVDIVEKFQQEEKKLISLSSKYACGGSATALRWGEVKWKTLLIFFIPFEK